jgi:hypothetical protein
LAQTAPLFAPAGSGMVRALVIGIDEYDAVPNLKGAAADARDFEAVLRKLGLRDLTVLIDRAASRRAVQAAMERLRKEARAGDLVLLALAGHGAREPERVKGSNADGFEKSFLFSGFDRFGPRTAERMLSTEIKAWIHRLEQQGIDVLFVADTCHGGGLIRQVDPRAGELSYRTVGQIALHDDDLKPISTTADAFRDEADFKRLTFLAAADKETKAPEVPIPGIPGLRGALSYAMARALEGAVDRDRNGIVTRRQLFEYSRQVVYQHSQTRQAIWTEPISTEAKLDAAVFRSSAPPVAPPVIVPDVARKTDPIRIRTVNGTGNPLGSIEPLHLPFRVVAAGEPADLTWDAGKQEVISAAGDVVARDIGPSDLPGVVDRTGAVRAVARLAQSRPQTIVAKPNDAHQRAGQRIWIEIEGISGKFLLLFNIAGDGTVQHLFPKPNEDPLIRHALFKLDDVIVQKPFGADHVVAVVSEARLDELEQALLRLHGRRRAGRLPDVLQSVAGSAVRLGTAGLFTVP